MMLFSKADCSSDMTAAGPAPEVVLEAGPDWLTMTALPDDGGWLARATPPNPDVPETYDAVYASAGMRQAVTIRVLDTPEIAEARRKGRKVRIDGRNFGPNCGVRIDGVLSDKVKVKRPDDVDGDGTRIIARIPKALRKGFKKVDHDIEVVDAETGLASLVFTIARRGRK